MKEIKIKIPDRCGEGCLCLEKAESNIKKTYYICRAFNRVLTISIDMLGNVRSINRCEECQRSLEELLPKNATEGEDE